MLRWLNSAVINLFSRQHFIPAFSLAGYPDLSTEIDEQKDEEEDFFSPFLFAVPKRRVSHRRKRIKYFQKHLQPLEGFKACSECGMKHPSHYQLCPFCKPYNNFIRAKDVPKKLSDRIAREYEVKKLAELYKAQHQEEEENKKKKLSSEEVLKLLQTDINQRKQRNAIRFFNFWGNSNTENESLSNSKVETNKDEKI